MLKAILWDFDGVIIDSPKHHLEAWKKAFADAGRNLTDEEVVKKVFYQFGVEEDKRYKINNQIMSSYLKNIDREIQKVELHSGVKKTLNTLHKDGLKMAIVSFVEKERINPILKRFEIDKYFDLVLGFGDVVKVKPNPEVAFKALNFLKIKPEDSVLVGDTGLDIQTGKNAGSMTAFYYPEVNRLYTDMELFRGVKPDLEFRNFDEFIPSIERFLK